ncbi:hypothetical protein IWQ56_006578, partial [Coemansia nantahalensis]
SLPPLSPVVSSRRRTLRSDLAQEAAHPFSPTSSAMRIRYPPSSPLSPTLRSTPCRGEPESPTLLRRLVKESPSLSLDEKLGSGIGASGRHGLEDESPSVSNVSRSLLFRLDLESPTTRKTGPAADGARPTELSPLIGSARGWRSGAETAPLLATADEATASSEERPGQAQQPRCRLWPAAAKTAGVPQFYVSPLRPRTDSDIERAVALELEQVRKHFDSSFGAREVDFAKVTVGCGLPRFANRALFRYVSRSAGEASMAPAVKRPRLADREAWPSYEHFSRVWLQLRRASADAHALVFNILIDDPTKPRAHLTRADIKVLVSDVVHHHSELEFLEGQDQFLQSYTETVVERIFYVANRTWDGRLLLPHFRRADVVGMLHTVEDGIDVNVDSPGVFSYKHFYVLFCSFFELDTN